MVEREIQIEMPAGKADAVFFAPGEGTTYPGILFLPDIGSIRDANRGMARRLAAEGYAVLLPNPFYRTGQPPMWTFPRNFSEQRTKDRFSELTAPLTPAARAADADAYIDRLREQPEVKHGSVGIVGYCFTGAMALRGPSTRPDAIAAAASFHGGNLYDPENAASPYKLLPQVRCRLYFGHATDDHSMTAEQIAGFEQALAAWGGQYESETYPAKHGWTVPENPAYDEHQAERAWNKLVELFRETLR